MSEQLTGISSMATRQVLAEVVQDYERLSGQPVVVRSVGGVDAARRVESGEGFDFVVLAADVIDWLEAAGHVVSGSRVDVARSGVAIAVASGAPRPDVVTEAALRDAVLAARSIGYSTGPSGSHLTRLFERWGIADAIAPRVVQAPPGVPVGALVARGDVELGFQQLSELMHLPGIDVIGRMPAEVQIVTVFSAGICTASGKQDVAKAFLSFLASSQCDKARLNQGMEPV
ncbi:substrate-binding domain-containing protein [Paraburkholderia sediminicola]|uniref:substrate-binding domain-containing protein n=1 Tax=Paraburkholderia sediminicola TaxID=458836 RepID=UPI0038B86528